MSMWGTKKTIDQSKGLKQVSSDQWWHPDIATYFIIRSWLHNYRYDKEYGMDMFMNLTQQPFGTSIW